MLLSISYTVERVENQLFMAVLCKMYEMCVIKRCSCSIKLPCAISRLGVMQGRDYLTQKQKEVMWLMGMQ